MNQRVLYKSLCQLVIVLFGVFVLFAGTCFGEVSWTKYAGTTITVMSWARPEVDVAISLIPEFEAKTGIKVKWIVMDGWELRAKAVREFSMGMTTMDVYPFHPSHYTAFLSSGDHIVDQMNYIKNPELTPDDWDFDDFMPAAKQANLAFDPNAAYSVPFTSQPAGIWYRNDLFEQNGIARPDTMEELELAAKKLTMDIDGDKNSDIYGWVARGEGSHSMVRTGGFVFAYGGAWWTHDRKSAIAKPETIAGITKYCQLLRTYGPPNPLELTFVEGAQLFAKGKAAMFCEGGEHVALFEDPARSEVVGKLGMGPYPAGPAGRIAAPEVMLMSIPKYSKNKEAAWLFLQWLTNKENAKRILAEGGAVVRRSALDDPEIKVLNKEWRDYCKLSLEVGSENFTMMNCIPLQEVRDLWGKVVDLGMEGESLEEFANEVAKEIDKKIEETETGRKIYMDPRYCYMPYIWR